jgi:hypothetical protein
MGLLNRTYTALDSQHNFRQKFGLNPKVLLADVAKKLGAKVPVEELLGSALGGTAGAPATPGKP